MAIPNKVVFNEKIVIENRYFTVNFKHYAFIFFNLLITLKYS